ncbi:MAG TPA: cytochrome c biogenesis protein CcsA, partial [Pirellulales bacterium]
KSGDKIEKINGRPLEEYSPEQISEAFDGADNKTAELTLATGSEAARTVKMQRVRQPAVKWLLDVMARPEIARKQRVLRIDSLDVLAEFNLRHRSGYLFSADELSPHAEEFQKLMDGVGKKNAGELTTIDKKAKELDTRAEYYQRLADAFHLVPTPMGNLAMPLPEIFTNAVSARFNLQMPEFPSKEEQRDDPKLSEAKINAWLQLADQYAGFLLKAQAPMVVPLAEVDNATTGAGQKPDDVWLPYSGAKLFGIRDEKEKNPPIAATVGWEKIIDAYAAQNTSDFNQAVADYAALIDEQPPSQLATSHPTFEAWFDNWSPFGHCEALYLLAICLTLISWLAWRGPLNKFAFWLIVFTFIGHTLALGFRMYISGRPPVTNLYSSAIFIGWAAVAAGLALEWIYRLGFGNLLAAVAGFATLIIADRLSLMLGESRGDTIGVMQAVLDTSFWLATHVTSEALGYMATYVAGLLGIIYVVGGVFSKSISAGESKDLARMIYGTVCFAMFFSFFGTVLGGLWADDSWGRFWGWDPKENGALIIVLWNALVLHARWDGQVKDRGLAVLAIGGNIVVSWSYFGVNQLGVGLHSYGFTEGVLLALMVFCASQLALIGVGLIPLDYWRSRKGTAATEAAA